MRKRLLVAVGISFALPVAGTLAAALTTQVAVYSGLPACAHEKLGSIVVEEGTNPSAFTGTNTSALVNYSRLLGRLADQATSRQANAVGIFFHNARYFTRGSKRSALPVYVKIEAAAIRILEPARCKGRTVDAKEMRRRAAEGDVEQLARDPDLPAQ